MFVLVRAEIAHYRGRLAGEVMPEHQGAATSSTTQGHPGEVPAFGLPEGCGLSPAAA
jgi:hypothetical protein